MQRFPLRSPLGHPTSELLGPANPCSFGCPKYQAANAVAKDGKRTSQLCRSFEQSGQLSQLDPTKILSQETETDGNGWNFFEAQKRSGFGHVATVVPNGNVVSWGNKI